ncbi:chorismate-binding protein, partial [Streptomyces sp. URMC 126]
MHDLPPMARFGGLLATDLRDVTSDPEALDSRGWWVVVAGFEGDVRCARFGDVRPAPLPAPGR